MRNLVKLEKLRYLIEPISICSYFLLAFINTVLTEYIFQRYSDDIGYDFSLSTSSTSRNCGNVTNSTQFDLLQKVYYPFTWKTKLSRGIQESASIVIIRSETVTWKLPEMIFWEISQNLLEKSARMLLAAVLHLYYKEIPLQVLYFEFCEKFPNNFFKEHLRTAASVVRDFLTLHHK